MTTITGNTYDVREQLKALGGRWNPTAKGWDVPDDKADCARAIVASAGAAAPAATFAKLPSGGWGVRGKGFAPGARVTVRKRDKTTSTETIDAILSTDADGWQTATIVRTEDDRAATKPARRSWRPCGYPGCSPAYCDECDGEGLVFEHRRGWGRR